MVLKKSLSDKKTRRKHSLTKNKRRSKKKNKKTKKQYNVLAGKNCGKCTYTKNKWIQSNEGEGPWYNYHWTTCKDNDKEPCVHLTIFRMEQDWDGWWYEDSPHYLFGYQLDDNCNCQGYKEPQRIPTQTEDGTNEQVEQIKEYLPNGDRSSDYWNHV